MGSAISDRTRYSEASFTELALGRAKLTSVEFLDCGFRRCSFAEAVLRRCRFMNCRFQECDLSLAQWPGSVFSGVQVEDSKVMGVNWGQAELSTKFQDPMCFEKCVVSRSSFLGLELKGLRVRNCAAVDVDFREADLTRADFSGTDLAESHFHETNLTEANLAEARNYRIDPRHNVLTRARFSWPEAMSLLESLDIILVER
jgi:fluoroquinolone resistance protein